MANVYLNVQSTGAFIDATGTAMVAGTLVVQPVDGNGNATPFRSGDDKQVGKTPIQRAIANGALAQALQLANPTHPEASPQSMGYTFTITDQTSGTVTTYPCVLIQDDGTGNWNIGALATGEYIKALPVTLVVGPAGAPGTNGSVLLGDGTVQPANPTQYALVNPANRASTTALNGGVSLYANNNAFGIDLGYQGSSYYTRLFAPDSHGFGFGVHPDGTAPTQQSSFRYLLTLNTQLFALYPGASGGPVLSATSAGVVNVTGTFTVNGGSVLTPATQNLNALDEYALVNQTQNGLSGADSDKLSGGVLFYKNYTGAYGAHLGYGPGGTYGTELFAPNNRAILMGFHDASQLPAHHSDIVDAFLLQPTGLQLFPSASGTSTSAKFYLDNSGNLFIAGSLAAAGGQLFSDALTGDSAATLVQVQSLVMSHRLSPVRYRSRAGMAYHAYGDSITAGSGVTNTTCYPYLAAQAVGAALTNRGVGGDEVCDTTLHAFNYDNSTAASNICFSVQIGTNDANNKGTGAHEAVFLTAHQALIAWLGTRAEDRVQCGTVSAANWAADSTFAAVSGATSTTNGATITYTLQTTGKPIYLWSLMRDGGGGAFTVTVDGGTPIVVNCAPSSPIATNNGGTTGVQLTRIPVAAGSHSVAITVTSASGGSNQVTLLAVGTPSQHTYYTSPTVVVGGVLPQEGDNKRSVVDQYTLDAMSNVLLLQGDGLDVIYADNRSTLLNGSNSGLYITTDYGQLHPNAAGHALLAQAFVYALSLAPSASVNRGTPLSGSGKGTPGDVWSDGTYTYAVTAGGTLTRSSAGSSWT